MEKRFLQIFGPFSKRLCFACEPAVNPIVAWASTTQYFLYCCFRLKSVLFWLACAPKMSKSPFLTFDAFFLCFSEWHSNAPGLSAAFFVPLPYLIVCFNVPLVLNRNPLIFPKKILHIVCIFLPTLPTE